MTKPAFYLKTLILLIGMVLISLNTIKAQRTHDSTHLDSLKVFEQKLKNIGDSMIDGSTQALRVKSLKKFIPNFVEALKIPGSFDYPFDSIRYVYKFTPPDKQFRLYNWHIKFANNTHRFYGVIQQNNKDSLEIYPLYDRVENALMNAEDTILNRNGWYGAQYFELVQKSIEDKKHYILFGWDGFNKTCNRKLIDVLTFKQNGEPQFGAPIFKKDNQMKKRIMFVYNNDATMNIDYNKRKDVIAYDNLVPPNKRSRGSRHTYVPDGTYSYFVFKPEKGYWVQKNNLFKGGVKPAQEADN